jgi:hypothetical protein
LEGYTPLAVVDKHAVAPVDLSPRRIEYAGEIVESPQCGRVIASERALPRLEDLDRQRFRFSITASDEVERLQVVQ